MTQPDPQSVLQKRLTPRLTDPPVYEVDILTATDDELVAISAATSIGLDLAEMGTVRDHFASIGRNPTDIELESLGQAWSEHCCYKSSKPVLKRHVYGIAEEKLVCREDAGVAKFDGDWDYVVKIESHNHPSAIEPYGGAATGIGGVVRDVVCMGAQPIALVDPLFFGSLATKTADLPAGTKHPKYLANGVVAGIRDYGNRIGVPTVAGLIHFHPKFLTNCLVNVGCVGIMKREDLIHSRVGQAGDTYILLGGRTGRDGIHGVTFASADLAEDADESSRGAVQLGDPITKEPLIHLSLELNARKLLTGMKDLGGGGLSCVCGEMALDAGVGAEIRLDTIPTKEAGMKPWEIWVSESQERMMVTVLEENVEDVLALAREWDVEAAVIGTAIPEKVVRLTWNGDLILEMDSTFLYGGPVYERPREDFVIVQSDTPPAEPGDVSGLILRLLASENLASREPVIRQYDHEVRGGTVIKPLQGKLGAYTHGDAAVLKPVADSWKGLALTCDVNPNLTDIDPYRGSVYAMEETLRNLAATGARIDSVADNLNLPNPQKPKSMGAIEACAQGLGDSARTLNIPFSSGNVSMYNESPTTPIPCTPSILGVGIVSDIRKAQTVDFKKSGNAIYHVGTVRAEMAGSEYYRATGGRSTIVPAVDWTEAQRSAEAVVTAIEKGLVSASHDVGMGGLAIALIEMSMGGDVGCDVDLTPLGDSRADVKLFSESASRYVLEARDPRALEAHFAEHGVVLTRLGTVGGDSVKFADAGIVVGDVNVADAHREFSEGLRRLM